MSSRSCSSKKKKKRTRTKKEPLNSENRKKKKTKNVKELVRKEERVEGMRKRGGRGERKLKGGRSKVNEKLKRKMRKSENGASKQCEREELAEREEEESERSR